MLSIVAALLLAAPAVGVDDWVPYEDGRPGGCYRTASGLLYSCSRPSRAETKAAAEAAAQVPAVIEDEAAPADAASELRAVRRELEALKLRQDVEDARRASEMAERDQVERAAKDAEQRDLDAAMTAHNEIEGAKDSERLRLLDEKTQACRGALEKRGFRIVGPGACQAPDETYVNCPEC